MFAGFWLSLFPVAVGVAAAAVDEPVERVAGLDGVVEGFS